MISSLICCLALLGATQGELGPTSVGTVNISVTIVKGTSHKKIALDNKVMDVWAVNGQFSITSTTSNNTTTVFIEPI